MSTSAATLPVRVPRVLPAALAVAAVAGVVTVRVTGVGEGAVAQNLVLVFASIVIEALPFVLLGAVVSGLIEVLVPERWFAAIGRLPARLQVPGAVVGGLAFPVCECGSVPVARRLILRGVHPAAGLTFMLAAPVLNPVVLLSTFVAYQGREAVAMVAGRAALGALVAVVAGWALGGGRGANVLVRRRATSTSTTTRTAGSRRSAATWRPTSSSWAASSSSAAPWPRSPRWRCPRTPSRASCSLRSPAGSS